MLVFALVLSGLAAGLLLSAADGADSPSSLLRHADALRAENHALGQRAEAAWLSAVSLDTRLRHSRAALADLQVRSEEITRQRSAAEFDLRLARRALRVSQERLAGRLRTIYEEGEADPVAVLLGSESIGEAIDRLDRLDRVALQDRRYLEAARSARARLTRLTQVLAEREAEARRARDAAAATVAALDVARRERTALLSQLRSKRNANSAWASQLDSQARALATEQPAEASAPVPTAASGGRSTLTVTATGYSLRGRTSTGVAVAWGIAAVDPSVIPLGTRLTVPGYGAAVAADTGGSVSGTRIDLWFPTVAEALAWGTRSVTITLR